MHPQRILKRNVALFKVISEYEVKTGFHNNFIMIPAIYLDPSPIYI